MKSGFYILMMISIGLASCISSKSIRNNLVAKKHSLVYLYDSQENEKTLPQLVKVEDVLFNGYKFPRTTQVKRQKQLVIPALFVNIWNATDLCIQGKDIIEEQPETFFKSAIEQESKRSGRFYLDSTDEDSSYLLEVSIDTLDSRGLFKQDYMVLYLVAAYSYQVSYHAGPAYSKFNINYSLRHNDEIVYQNTIREYIFNSPINKNYKSATLLQHAYAISFVEAISMNMKKASERIVEDLNNYFSGIKNE